MPLSDGIGLFGGRAAINLGKSVVGQVVILPCVVVVDEVDELKVVAFDVELTVVVCAGLIQQSSEGSNSVIEGFNVSQLFSPHSRPA